MNMSPEEDARHIELQKQEDERLAAERKADFLKSSNVPARYLAVKPKLTGEWGAKLKLLSSKLGTGFSMALIGPWGTGKTQMAAELVKIRSDSFKRSRFSSVTEFFMEIKSGYSNNVPELDVIQDFMRPSLLILDEIGKRSDTEWENKLLYELLNNRYGALKDTLLISNQSVEEFEKSIGPALVSRMRETGGLIECKWSSYRG